MITGSDLGYSKHEPDAVVQIDTIYGSIPVTLVELRHCTKMLTGNHTVECRMFFYRFQLHYEAYRREWPHYCTECDGAGVHSWDENQAPIGSGMNWPEPMSEACEGCWASGYCPRCGMQSFEWDDNGDCEGTCPACGWTENSQSVPEYDYCGCTLMEPEIFTKEPSGEWVPQEK